MTITATLLLPEATARRLADALSEDTGLPVDAVDLLEARDGQWRILVYFPGADARLRRTFAEVAVGVTGPTAAPEWHEVGDRNWVRVSQAALPPVRAGRIAVFGRHARHKVRANELAIAVEAAEAFGTGHHGTTRGCLLAIQRVVRARTVRSALDIGTGTGVLAIGLARLKIPVIATDIDPVAVRIARENAAANGVGGNVRVLPTPARPRELTPGPFHRGYDLVVANILLGPLLALAGPIRRALAPGGTVVLSGLTPDQQRQVIATYRAHGLRLVQAAVVDGWLTVIMERPGSAVG